MLYRYKWDVIILVLTPLVIFILSTITTRKPNLQHLVAIALSSVTGALYTFSTFLTEIFKSKCEYDILLDTFCPIVVIKLIYAMDTYMFTKSIPQILILFVIGFPILVTSVGVVAEFATRNDVMSLLNIIIYGLIYQVCDIPVIVSKADRVKNLDLLITSESFLCMAATTIALEIIIGVNDGYINTYYHIISVSLRYITVALFLGLVCGFFFSFLLRKSYSDKTNIILVILSSSYFGYALAEQYLCCSGVITCGIIICMLSQERSGLSPQVDNEVKQFLNVVFDIVLRIVIIFSCLITSIHSIENYNNVEIIVGVFGYLIQITFRTIIFTILSVILSRLGCGFNFTSLIILMWRPTKGPLILLLFLKLYAVDVAEAPGLDTFIYMYVFYILQSVGNTFFQITTLNKFNLGKFSPIHQNTVSNAIKIIQNRRDRCLAVMKMNRFFSGANWTVINNVTKMQNPYETDDENLFENIFSYSARMTTCPKCFQRLHVQPTKAEIQEMSRAAGSRILKAQRISFVQQYEKGYLNKDQINELLYVIDLALDSKDLFISTDGLFKEIKESIFYRHIRLCLEKYQPVQDNEVPTSPFKKLCHRISNHILFEIATFAATLALIIDKIETTVNGKILTGNVSIETAMHLILSISFFIVINGYSSKSYGEGIKRYMSYSWNRLDLVSLIVNSIELYVVIIRYAYNETKLETGIISLKIIASIRILRIFKYIVSIYPKLAARYQRKLDQRALFSYTIGKAIVVSYEEVIQQLNHLADDQNIREALKIKLHLNKNVVMEQLSALQKIRPWISGTVETKQSIKCTLKAMKNYAHDLKNSGLIEAYELNKVIIALDERFRNVHSYLSIETVAPSKLFSEIAWIYGDTVVHEYLYSHISNRIWKAGEIVCYNGDLLDTIFLVVEGIFTSYYKPVPDFIQRLDESGRLPVKEFLTASNFLEEQTEFILVGNFIGELSILTGRECSNTIVCYLPARVLVLSKKVLYEAMKLNPNPVYGLWSRLWKKVSFNLVLRLLLDSVSYESTSQDKSFYLLDNAFVPNLKNYKTLNLCEYVLDVVLIDGIIVDYITKEVYKAPCCMPRSVQKFLFLTEHGETILCIIPVKNIDPMDLMFRLEQTSDLVQTIDGTLLISKFLNKTKTQGKPNTSIIINNEGSSSKNLVVAGNSKDCRCVKKAKRAEF